MSSCASVTFFIVVFCVTTTYWNSLGCYRCFGGTNRCLFSLDHVTTQRATMWVYKNFQENLITGWMTGESGVDYWQCGNFIFYLQRPHEPWGLLTLLDCGYWDFLLQCEARQAFEFSDEECIELYMLIPHRFIKHRDNCNFRLSCAYFTWNWIPY
jgi:hypothetical protein